MKDSVIDQWMVCTQCYTTIGHMNIHHNQNVIDIHLKTMCIDCYRKKWGKGK